MSRHSGATTAGEERERSLSRSQRGTRRSSDRSTSRSRRGTAPGTATSASNCLDSRKGASAATHSHAYLPSGLHARRDDDGHSDTDTDDDSDGGLGAASFHVHQLVQPRRSRQSSSNDRDNDESDPDGNALSASLQLNIGDPSNVDMFAFPSVDEGAGATVATPALGMVGQGEHQLGGDDGQGWTLDSDDENDDGGHHTDMDRSARGGRRGPPETAHCSKDVGLFPKVQSRLFQLRRPMYAMSSSS